MAEFSQRSVAIEERKTMLVAEFAAAHGRQPTNVEVLDLRRRATLETRPAKEHRSLAEMTAGWRQRAERYVGERPIAPGLLASRIATTCRCLRAGDLADGILADAAGVAVQTVAERRATFSRANLLAEVHRQLHGVRFASPEERIAVAERTTDLATAQSLLDLRPRAAPHAQSACAGATERVGSGLRATRSTPPPPSWRPRARLLEAGRQMSGPAISMATVATVTAANLPGRDHPLSLDQAIAVEQIATSGRSLDVLVGPAGTGKSTTMAGLRAVWEAEHGAGSVLGPRPFGSRGRGVGRRARHRHREHGQVALRAPPRGRAAEQD